MSYWFRRRERYHRPASNVCPSRWMVSPPKHVLRGWPTCYDGGTDTCAERTPLGWRYTCLFGGHTIRRRYWSYICWADTSWLTIHLPLGRTYYDGGTDTYICWTDTSWLTIHLHLPLERTYMLRRRYISWADNTHVLRCSRIAYTFYLGEHHLGGATRNTYTSYLGGRLIW